MIITAKYVIIYYIAFYFLITAGKPPNIALEEILDTALFFGVYGKIGVDSIADTAKKELDLKSVLIQENGAAFELREGSN